MANLYNLISVPYQSYITSDEPFIQGPEALKSHVTPIADQFVTLSNGDIALKMTGDPYITKAAHLILPISGNKGDAYDLCFWAKNLGINCPLIGYSRSCVVNFTYTEEVPGHGLIPTEILNSYDEEWQFFHMTFVAEASYSSIRINFLNDRNANEIYLANFSLLKRLESSYYDYDDNGNLILSYDPANKKRDYKYDQDNQLIAMTDVKGSNFTYEYDQEVKDRVISTTSPTGITNKITYDNFGNPIVTTVQNVGNELEETTYYIRKYGSDRYLEVDLIDHTLHTEHNTCSYDSFKLIKEGDYYKIESVEIPNYYFQKNENKVILSQNYDLFDLIRNDNGSYRIRLKDESLSITDTEPLTLTESTDSDTSFYLETIEERLFIQNKSTYTEDGKFVKSVTDTLDHTVLYDIDPITGLMKQMTDPKGNTTQYTYNSRDQLTQIKKGKKKVLYEYNRNQLLSKITNGTKNYHFAYDSFLNVQNIQINNQNLITNQYENNNGNLLSSTYGNDHTVSYEYDDYDRLTKTIKMDDTYRYQYDNLGNISRIDTTDHIYQYYYDLGSRITGYHYDDFRIKYRYLNDQVDSKYYDLNDFIANLSYTYNKEDAITKLQFDDQSLHYHYDSLGRLIKKDINTQYDTNYQYVTNGNKTSYLLKELDNNNDKYRYRYNKLNNITHIYHNDELINEYEYDQDNQLIRENNYVEGKMYFYSYDEAGNIKKKKEYQLVKEDTYEYNNTNWEDQLTKFNDDTITYDEIGNPLTIGDTTLTWVNGRQLKQYQHGSNVVTYEYNKDGIRTSKTIGNVKTNYYLENEHIIFEKTGNNVIYYIRDGVGELIGFKYNNEIYYYMKNAQNDIIGLLNSNYQVVANYTYDSWGNILTITDSNNQDIRNDNTHIANINPFRYRSYYYDQETNFYYLNSRYYNPVWGRFLTTDYAIVSTNNLISLNLYAYAMNNPVNNIDPNGNFLKKLNKLFNDWKNGVEIIKKEIGKAVNSFNKWVKETFVFEAGVGTGVGASAQVGPIEGQVSTYKDFNWGISDGVSYNSTTTSAGAKIQATEQLQFGFGIEVNHVNDDNLDNWAHNNPMVMPWEIWNCPNTSKNILIVSSFNEYGSIEDSNDGIFIGIAIDAHIVVGGHIKIGFNIANN